MHRQILPCCTWNPKFRDARCICSAVCTSWDIRMTEFNVASDAASSAVYLSGAKLRFTENIHSQFVHHGSLRGEHVNRALINGSVNWDSAQTNPNIKLQCICYIILRFVRYYEGISEITVLCINEIMRNIFAYKICVIWTNIYCKQIGISCTSFKKKYILIKIILSLLKLILKLSISQLPYFLISSLMFKKIYYYTIIYTYIYNRKD